jgi:hypothetical protein
LNNNFVYYKVFPKLILVVTQTTLAIIAIAAAIGIIGVVVVVETFVIPLQQVAEARRCPFDSQAFNASQGRCFGPTNTTLLIIMITVDNHILSSFLF